MGNKDLDAVRGAETTGQGAGRGPEAQFWGQ